MSTWNALSLEAALQIALQETDDWENVKPIYCNTVSNCYYLSIISIRDLLKKSLIEICFSLLYFFFYLLLNLFFLFVVNFGCFLVN